MYHAMESFNDEFGKMYQRALRMKGFDSLEKAIKYAQKRSNNPFVCKGVSVVWTN